MNRMNFYKSLLKPLADFVLSLLLLFFLFPFLILIAIFLWFNFRSSPFFVQERVGAGGRIFKLLKFRTFKDPDDFNSIPRTGQVLRKTSMDELPQLINILKGDMSFVGPRPLYPAYVPYFTKKQLSRHHVLPGLTGLSQVELGNISDWSKRLSLDVNYVENQSFLLDLSVLFKTLRYLFSSSRREDSTNEVIRFDEYIEKNEESHSPVKAKH